MHESTQKIQPSQATALTAVQNTVNVGADTELPEFTFSVQCKLTIGAVDDPLEKEADAMADRVLRMPQTPFVQRKCAQCEEEEKINRKLEASFLQRKCAHCEEEEKQLHRKTDSFIMKKGSDAGTIAPDAVARGIESTRGSGEPLPFATKNFMEERFNQDFSGVHIHTGNYARDLSNELSAQAFTIGNDIYFNAGKFSPDTTDGKHLLAHELTHVVQQGGVQRKVSRMVDEDRELLQATTSSGLIQRQEAPISRAQEIARSRTSPGEAEVSLQPFSLSLFNFAINDHYLKQEHRRLLSEMAILLSHPNTAHWRIEVTGHADATGEPVVNDPLSLRRANEVRRYLRARIGGRIPSHGEGEEMPIATNESVSGRNRNRRVDIIFVPTRSVLDRDQEEDDIIPDDDRRRDDDLERRRRRREEDPRRRRRNRPETDDWICIQAPLLCAIGGGLLGALLLCGVFWELCLCMLRPSMCTIPPPPPPPPPDRDPDRNRRRPSRHACVAFADLPSGNLNVFAQWPFLMLEEAFWMFIGFREDPQQGCFCTCGEFQQNVRGFFETEYRDGRVERRPKLLTPGIYLEENTFHEDGSGAANSEYGHRSHPPRAIDDEDQTTFDAFFHDQDNGCYYLGNDMPGFGSPFAEADVNRKTIFLEFEGGPVDRCIIPGVRTPLRQHWSTWRVRGEITRPPTPTPQVNPPPTPTPGGGGGQGGVQVVPVTPTPSHAQPTSEYASSYGGGISPTAGIHERYDLRLNFRIAGRTELFQVTVPVQVVNADADSVTVETSNAQTLNVAPAGEQEILLQPHRRITISREVLRRF
jgi:outer membrane protein OmpA-like peptidoglycan-associated protein